MRGQWLETCLGLLVLIAAGAFLAYVLEVADFPHAPRGYVVLARFGEVGALAPGASVRVAGVKVGTVVKVTLDPKTYMAITRLELDKTLVLPSDSTARITADGLLGGAHVAIMPGGAAENIEPGGEIENTQGAVDLFGLIGQIMRPQAAAVPAADGATAKSQPVSASQSFR